MEDLAKENTKEINEQNIKLLETATDIKEMIRQIQEATTVEEANELTNKQNHWVKETAAYNNTVVENVKEENMQFEQIDLLAQNNKDKIQDLFSSMCQLNEMIADINQLLHLFRRA